jgi:hypothetical protein
MICNHEENKRGKLVPNGVSKQIRRSQKRDTFLASQKNRGQKQEADLGSSRLGTVFSCGKVKPSDMQSTMTRQEIEQKMDELPREYYDDGNFLLVARTSARVCSWQDRPHVRGSP